MGITPQALDFLFENRIKDNKEWYREHKETHKQLIIEPFREFVVGLEPYMQQIDPTLVCNPKRISRIYRDTRFTKDKSVFRDTVWCTVMHGSELYEGYPAFYFEFSPRGFNYGMGYYKASAKAMETIRELIINKDRLYNKAKKALKNQDVFTLAGDLYKRNHYPDASAEDCSWLNRKSICFLTESKDFDLLFSDSLADKVGSDFVKIAPVYDFLMKAEAMSRDIRK